VRVFRTAVLTAFLVPLVSSGADEPVRIGMPSVFTRHPFHAELERGASEAAKGLGAQLLVLDAYCNAAEQIASVKAFVGKGVRAIVISPMPAAGITPALEEAVKAGVVVVTVDNKVETDKVLFHSGVDGVEVGRIAARFVIEKLGSKGSVLEIEGVPGWSSGVERKTGFDESSGNPM